MPKTTAQQPSAATTAALEPAKTPASAKTALKGKNFDAQAAALRPDAATDLEAQRAARPTQVMALDKADKADSGASRWAEAVQRYFSRWDTNTDGKLTLGEVNRTMARGVVTAPDKPAERVSGKELMALAALKRGSHLFKGAITLSQIQTYADDFKTEFGSRHPDERPELMGIEAAYVNGTANVEAAAELEASHNAGNATPADLALQPLKQGGLVSCSMLTTAAGMLGRDPAAISSMVKFLGTTVEPSKGRKLGEKYYRFEVNFCRNGKPQKSEVKLFEYDMLLAARGGGLAYAAIEALFVLGQGDIRSFTSDSKVGTTGTKAIEAMTGTKAKYLEIKKTSAGDLTKAITAATSEKRIVVAGTTDKAPKGISASHAYTVLACDGSTVSLFDPHAKDPEGADGVTADGKSDGYFTMKMESFLAAFHHVDIEQPKKTD